MWFAVRICETHVLCSCRKLLFSSLWLIGYGLLAPVKCEPNGLKHWLVPVEKKNRGQEASTRYL
jgi:hypothetical protein